MKKKINIFLTLLIAFATSNAFANEEVFPTVEPANFQPDQEITVTYDVTGTALENLNDAWIWVWIPGETSIDAKYNFNPASSNTELTDNAKFQKTVDGGTTLFSITFIPQNLFDQPICLETELGMLIKGNDWSDGQSVDHVEDMTPLETCFVVDLQSPADNPAFLSEGEDLYILATASDPATFTLTVNGVQVDQREDITYYSITHPVPQEEGTFPVSLNVSNAENDTTLNFSYLINFPSEELPKPAGIIPGINYSDDDTRATLCLLAPGKEAVYVLGEFNGFEFSSENKMYRDGDYFWLEITDLIPEQEYAFRYLVDGVFIADPFADKILTPEDVEISDSIYPNLKEYPSEGREGVWYKDKLSVIQTNQTEYTWEITDFQKPKTTDLVIYELLIRDFFEESERHYDNLIDTLDYLKRLGVNAIELMPVQEFGGNNSWGYNPQFMFAPDKAYGTKEALKRFIDAAHKEGMAVILDVVFNQQDTPNSFLSMWFDYDNFQVKADNPMFNVSATHPFSVFFDMNHESQLTQYYMDTTLHYWITEYQVDGYRFDLSKGFTQTNSGNNVGQWGQYDQSRIDLLTRMYDKIREYSSDSYLILEHFADNDEETVLSNYGFMLWGNMHWDYKDLVDGLEKNISWIYHGNRGWQDAHVVGYMESHDEQRMMFEHLTDQNSNEDLIRDDRDNPRAVQNALFRMKLANAFFYTVPGPKMLWQFGELGYDEPINLCSDGQTIGKDGNCRTDPKPVLWEYQEDQDRSDLFDFTSSLIHLKTEYSVFETGEFSMTSNNSLIKEISLANVDGITSPSSADEMSVYVIGNFDMDATTVTASFPSAGTWFDYFNEGATMELTSNLVPMELKAGEFRLFVNYEVDFPEGGLTDPVASVKNETIGNEALVVFPNPSNNLINLSFSNWSGQEVKYEILDLSGHVLSADKLNRKSQIDISQLSQGVYLLKLKQEGQSLTQKIIKK